MDVVALYSKIFGYEIIILSILNFNILFDLVIMTGVLVLNIIPKQCKPTFVSRTYTHT